MITSHFSTNRLRELSLDSETTFSGMSPFYQSVRTMFLTSSLLLKVVLILMFERLAGQSDCNGCCATGNYKPIDEPRRSIESIWKLGQVALCDRALPWGWYRFTSFVGGEMPTTWIRPNHCGTTAPIWLNGKHPASVGDGVKTVKACTNFFDINNGCAQSYDIGIKKCNGNFFVYYLRPTYSCAIAYCAGKGTSIIICRSLHINTGM